MENLDPNFRELLRCLNARGVRYMVVGGYAVNFHGHHRNTADIDLWITVDNENATKVSVALQQFGFSPESVPASMFLQRGKVFRFGSRPLLVDLITDPSGVDFEACYARRQEQDVDGLQVPFISLEDLKDNKRAAGRPKDIADLDALP